MDAVHYIKEKTGGPEVTAKGKDAHTFYAKCGYQERAKDSRKPDNFTVWKSEVTCRGCL